MLRGPSQRPPRLPGGGADLLISGLFLAHSPCISSPEGLREQLAGFEAFGVAKHWRRQQIFL